MTDEPNATDLERRIQLLESRAAEEPRRGRPSRDGLETALMAMMRKMLPDETRGHMRSATREQLLAARSYLDHWLARLDEKDPEDAAADERERISID